MQYTVHEVSTITQLLTALPTDAVKRIAIDLETIGLVPQEGDIATAALCIQLTEEAALRFQQGPLLTVVTPRFPDLEPLAKLLDEKFKHHLVAHNSEYERSWIEEKTGTDLRFEEDTMLSAHQLSSSSVEDGLWGKAITVEGNLYKPVRSFGLKEWVKRLWGVDYAILGNGETVSDLVKTKKGLAKLQCYNAQDAFYTCRLSETFEQIRVSYNKAVGLDPDLQLRYQHQILMPVHREMCAIQERGLLWDDERWTGIEKRLSADEAKLIRKVKTMTGITFNSREPKELCAWIEGKGIPTVGKLGGPFRREILLLAIEEEKTDVAKLIEVLDKLYYARAVLNQGRPFSKGAKLGDGRLHSRFNITGAATGRITAVESKDHEVALQSLMKDQELKSCIIADPGYELIQADFSSQEMRILASFADDPVMTQALRDGEDLHATTARAIGGANIPEDQFPIYRAIGKTTNFAVLYGGGEHKLYEGLRGALPIEEAVGITMDDARQARDGFFRAYPRVKKYQDSQYHAALRSGDRNGGVPLLVAPSGLVRPLYNFRVRPNPQGRLPIPVTRKGFATRTYNFQVQATGAILLQIAVRFLTRELENQGLDAEILLTVHDSIVIESRPEEREEVLEVLGRLSDPNLYLRVLPRLGIDPRVSLPLDVTWGPSLGEESGGTVIS